MPVISLNKRTIDAIAHPVAGQILYRDASLPGFGLRVGTTTKVFFVEGQVLRRTIRTSIGRYGILTPDMARKRALKLLGEMADGRNPNEELKTKVATSMTLREAFDSFFNRRALQATSRENYRRSIDIYLSDWADKPVAEISRQMVLDRHQKMARENGPIQANCVMRHLRS